MFEFNCSIAVYGVNNHHYNIMNKFSPDNITLTKVDKIDDTVIKQYDYIIAKTSPEKLMNITKNIKLIKGSLENLIVVLSEQAFDNTDIAFDTVWQENMSDKRLKYSFEKLVKDIEKDKNYDDIQEVLGKMMNTTKDLIWVKDCKGAHKIFNEPFLEALPRAGDGHKKTREECTDRGHLFLWELSKEDYSEGEYICMESEVDVINANKTLTFDETLLVGEGDLRNLFTMKSPLHDKKGNIIGTVGVAKDVTQELRYKDLLERQANVDHLTELYNRRYMYQYIETLKDNPFVVIYMDIDNFKYVNDEYGHGKGDDVLILTADTIKASFSDCVVCRIGGDEFIAIASNMNDELRKSIDGFPRKMKKIYNKDPYLQQLGISLGYAINNPNITDIENLFAEADKMMYLEKRLHKALGEKKSSNHSLAVVIE